MVEHQKNGQRSSIVFGIAKRDFGSSCSSSVNYKPIDIQKRKHWLMSQRENALDGAKLRRPELPPFDKESLIKTSFVLGSENPSYETETTSSYIERDLNDADLRPTVSIAALQGTSWSVGTSMKPEYSTTFQKGFISQKAVPQVQRTTSKQELQKSHIIFGDPTKRYFEVSTK